jgi:sensor histidine kinase regulating citrate/malate metabolism
MVTGLSKSNNALLEFERYKQNRLYQEEFAKNLTEQHEELRRLRHDMKQNYIVLETLVEDGDKDKLLKYLNKSTEKLKNLEPLINTENASVNAILNAKIMLAKSNGIHIFYSTVKKFNGIEDADLCVLFGNMLDNAIEGCMNCEPNERYIELTITSDDDKFIIAVKNTVPVSVLSSNADLSTTKSNKRNHGYGIKTIKTIVQTYQGNTNFYEEDGLFCCRVILYRQIQNSIS